jgi:hypothetical protein
VNEPPTNSALTSSLDPAPLNQLVTYTAVVTNQSGAPITGTVTFIDNGQPFAKVPLVNNRAACSASYTKIGRQEILTAYSGDANNAPSYATIYEYIAVFPILTKTVVATSGSPSLLGQSVTFTATVTSKEGEIPDDLLMTFIDGSTAIGTATTAAGVATFATSLLTANTHDITALYAGDGTFAASRSGILRQVVNKDPTTTALVSSTNPSTYKQAVTFTVTVTPSGKTPPSGRVALKDGTTTIGVGTLSAAGVVTFTRTNLALGSHVLTAHYVGDSNSAPSESPVLDQVVSSAENLN